MSVAAVIVAAGQGQRYGGAKQFAVLNHDTVTTHSVRAARSVAERVVLVVPTNYQGNGEGADVVVVGGATRAASVRAGLEECGDADVIVVHDAARPLATPALFASVVDAVLAGADGAIPGLPISDTVKRIQHDGNVTVVTATEARDELVTVQTPQAFARDMLIRAHATDDDATDDAALVEALGGRVVVVPGEVDNVKITAPGDLAKLRRSRSADENRPWARRASRERRRDASTLAGSRRDTGRAGLVGHSDADVATHALCDALLGRPTSVTWGATSPTRTRSSRVRRLVDCSKRRSPRRGGRPAHDLGRHHDHCRASQTDRVHVPDVRELTAVVGALVTVKATTAEGIGALGRVEGIGASAVALLEEVS